MSLSFQDLLDFGSDSTGRLDDGGVFTFPPPEYKTLETPVMPMDDRFEWIPPTPIAYRPPSPLFSELRPVVVVEEESSPRSPVRVDCDDDAVDFKRPLPPPNPLDCEILPPKHVRKTLKPLAEKLLPLKSLDNKSLSLKSFDKKPLAEKPLTEKPSTEKPLLLKSLDKKSLSLKPSAEKLLPLKPLDKKSSTLKPLPPKPLPPKSFDKKSSTLKPLPPKLLTKKPLDKKSSTLKPLAKKPLDNKSSILKPSSEKCDKKPLVPVEKRASENSFVPKLQKKKPDKSIEKLFPLIPLAHNESRRKKLDEARFDMRKELQKYKIPKIKIPNFHAIDTLILFPDPEEYKYVYEMSEREYGVFLKEYNKLYL